MQRLILIALMVLPACAQSKGEWPSLAPRAIENTPASPLVATPVPTVVSAPMASVMQADVRLGAAGRDVATLEARWQTQERTTTAAVAAARNTAPSSERWSAAQLELTRLGQVGSQIADLRVRLDRIAGDLAVASRGGADTRAAIDATGAMIVKVEALGARHTAAFAASDAALPR